MAGPGLGGNGPFAGKPVGGAPCRPRRTASILARISEDRLRPLPRLEMGGGAGPRGFRAALILPNGVEENVILAVAADVDTEWPPGRGRWSGDRREGEALTGGLVGIGGEDGEGESKGVSESYSPSGVDAAESIAAEVSVWLPSISGQNM